MAELYKKLREASKYKDRQFLKGGGTEDELKKLIAVSTTLYVGNLSFYTTEEQLYELFSKAGEIRRIIMGLDRNTKTPCGFAFVECVCAAAAALYVRARGGWLQILSS